MHLLSSVIRGELKYNITMRQSAKSSDISNVQTFEAKHSYFLGNKIMEIGYTVNF